MDIESDLCKLKYTYVIHEMYFINKITKENAQKIELVITLVAKG